MATQDALTHDGGAFAHRSGIIQRFRFGPPGPDAEPDQIGRADPAQHVEDIADKPKQGDQAERTGRRQNGIADARADRCLNAGAGAVRQCIGHHQRDDRPGQQGQRDGGENEGGVQMRLDGHDGLLKGQEVRNPLKLRGVNVFARDAPHPVLLPREKGLTLRNPLPWGEGG